MTLKNLILVFAGGGMGSILRYILGTKISEISSTSFPLGTWMVNVFACFILGILMGFAEDKLVLNSTMRLLLMVGFCGGFSTFSTFSAESLKLYQEGNYLTFAIYLVASNVACILSVLAGLFIVQKMGTQ